MTTPVGVEVWRGGRVESSHRVRACVADAAGRIVLAIGDVASPVFPRSAVKPFQTLALVETGAADALAVGAEELALACASHSAEAFHVARVEAWLARLGLPESALACGPHAPMGAAAAADLVRAGEKPRRVHNNCSGKHTGMLTVAKHLGVATAGYELADHLVQQLVARAMVEVAGLAALEPPGIDGCSLPNYPMPLEAIARAAAQLADPSRQAPPRRAALTRIADAMVAHPELVAGSGRCCSAIMSAAPHVVAKTGAEGVYLAAVRELGLGVAVKAEDGAGRAAEVAVLAVLSHVGALSEAAAADLTRFRRPVVRSFAGREVGHVAPADGWLDG